MENIDNNKILNIINTALISNGKKNIEVLKDEDSLRNDLGIDSLTMVDIVVKFDEEYGIDIFEGGMIQTVSDLKKILNNLL